MPMRGSRLSLPGDWHTVIEVTAVTLALFCGVLSLVRFYSRRRLEFLILGPGLIGAALFELIHLSIGTTLFESSLPSAFDMLSPWSWVVARFFLSIVLLVALLLRNVDEHATAPPPGRELAVYTIVIAAASATAIAFLVLRLPEVYYPDFFFARPAELVPGALFLVAAVVLFRQGGWRRSKFEHWFLTSVLLSAVGEIFFISQSSRLYGPFFYSGHILKIASYAALLVALLYNVNRLFQEADHAAEAMETLNRDLGVANEELDNLSLRLGRFSTTMKSLHRITTGDQVGYDELLQRYLETGCEALGLSTGVVSRVEGEWYLIRAVVTDKGWAKGDLVPLTEMFCSAVVERDAPVAYPVLSEEERWRDHPTRVDNGFESYIGAPIYAENRIYGTLCFASEESRNIHGFSEIDSDLMQVMAQTVGRLIERERNEQRREEVERLKEGFVSTVSHELRTPLTAMRGSLGLLAGGVAGDLPEKAQRMVEIASTNAERLVRLINDILDIETMKSVGFTLEKRSTRLDQLAGKAVDLMLDFAAEKGVTLTLQAEPLPVTADPDRIEQTFSNLLSNAVKFSKQGDVVEIVASKRDGEAVVAVQDSGRGIPPDKLGAIFGRFQQVDSSDSRVKGGTGLGLAICKLIVERHGGRMWVESVLGQGSTFWFALPLEQDRSAEATG
ncbi:MAG: ATP-binding protein [Actinomycetota bacterium]